MTKKIEYVPYQIIGPNNVHFIEDLPYEKNKNRKAKFKCPLCGDTFIGDVKDIKNGKIKSCGCFRKKPERTSRFDDLTGKVFGNLTVIKIDNHRNPSNKIKWICQCKCGNMISVVGTDLKNGKTKSCNTPGCPFSQILHGRHKEKDISGQKFGNLIAIKKIDNKNNGKGCAWLCKCDCGKTKVVYTNMLTSGNTKSCGCILSFQEERINKILQDLHIDFQRQMRFDTCINPKTKQQLRFDFYIPSKKLLIEYNGKQHYFPGGNEGWNNLDRFTEGQYRDNIKKQWCKNHSYHLHIIPYTDASLIDMSYIQNILSSYPDSTSKTDDTLAKEIEEW